MAQTLAESTHDWTDTPGSPTTLDEAWADVKTPGDGRIYSVGTIEIDVADATSRFSSAPVGLPPAPAQSFTGTVPRQVVILQVANSAGTILFQRYFYGFTQLSTGPGEGQEANARGISVFPVMGANNELDLGATRIAICGETYDAQIPLSQPGANDTTAAVVPNNDPGGFIAVYDGSLNLLWTHHFFGTQSFDRDSCAITDVSIRVEQGDGGPEDVVTYCGISSYGNPSGGNAFLTPVLPFVAPPGGLVNNPANGATDNGRAQWDGIVGRLRRASGVTTTVFHSIVGGREQDGLFGIAEIDADRFVVVGGTTSAPASASAFTFPFTSSIVSGAVPLSQIAAYCAGTTLVFDAGPTAALLPLELESSSPIGTVFEGSNAHTWARDVVVQPETFTNQGMTSGIWVVGSTDDSNLLANSTLQNTAPFQNAVNGPSDGFVVLALDFEPPAGVSASVVFWGGSFHGDDGIDGLTGIASWNEFGDHVAAVGFSQQGLNQELDTISVFADTAVAPGFITSLQLVRRALVGGAAAERPAAMGAREATLTSVLYQDPTVVALGLPAGGAVAQDSNARVNIVGATVSANYPTTAAPFLVGRGFRGSQDAVRTQLDMLPARMSRTDATGTVAGPAPAPAPPGGFTGGTSPSQCLSPFGFQIGSAAPALRRMMVDFEGPPPLVAGAPANLLIDRPPITSGAISALVQIGFPSPPAIVNGMEVWLGAPVVLATVLPGTPGSQRFALPLPPAPATFTFQVVCLLTANTCSGFPFAATPAMTIDY